MLALHDTRARVSAPHELNVIFEWIVDFQKQNHASGCDKRECDEGKTCAQGVGAVVEKADCVRAENSAELADHVDEAEGGGCR